MTQYQTEQLLKQLSALLSQREATQTTEKGMQFLEFSEKEISKMPKQFRKDFRTNGLRAHIRKRIRGNSTNYEIRCRRQGYNISASGTTLEEAKKRFIEKLHNFNNGITETKLPTNFHLFAMFYFENVRKRKTMEKTYYSDLNRYNNHIKPHFQNLQLKDVTVEYCQTYIDNLSATGKGKTTDESRSLINCIFNYAFDRGLINRNPMKPVVHIPHEKQSGHALTIEEETLLFNATYGTEYQTMFAIMLYTGMRPNEIRTATLVNDIIIAKNSKRKNAKSGKIEWKRIPICPNLAPFLMGITEIDMYEQETMRDRFNKIFPNHTLKDLRKTFYTRCETCGVNDKARDEFVGHSRGQLHSTYSELPDDYLKQEAQKISYPLNIQIAPISAPKTNRYSLAQKLGKPKIPRFTPQN